MKKNKMIESSNITVVLPIHIWDEGVASMTENAIKSIPEGILKMVVCSPFVEKAMKKLYSDVEFIVVEDDTCFQNMVNKAVEAVKTEWFSVLEFDDEYAPNWFNNFAKYQEYNQQYNIYLPLNDIYNVEGGKDEFVGNGNEVAWASAFSDELGVLDEKAIEDYFDFYLTGGIINTNTFRDLGGLKKSIKLTFWYEFLLRAAHKGEKVYVIPKVGYAHVIGRKDSLMANYRETIDAKESEFWFKTAKKVSYHKEDKEIVYTPKNESSDDED